jgi:hypothetical protein
VGGVPTPRGGFLVHDAVVFDLGGTLILMSPDLPEDLAQRVLKFLPETAVNA